MNAKFFGNHFTGLPGHQARDWTRRSVKKAAPWAAVIAKVEGGFMAFASTHDYSTWRKQR